MYIFNSFEDVYHNQTVINEDAMSFASVDWSPGLEVKPDMSKYKTLGFDTWQKIQIEDGLLHGVAVDIYANPIYGGGQMYELREGLEAGVDVSVYADPAYDPSQMAQLRLGLEAGIDVRPYAHTNYSGVQMEQIRRGLQDGIDLTALADRGYNGEQIKLLADAKKEGYDLAELVTPKFKPDQISQIWHALQSNIPVDRLLNQTYSGPQMYQLISSIQDKIDPEIVYTLMTPDMSEGEMRELRYGLLQQLDMSKYIDAANNAADVRDIRKLLEMGLDPAKYGPYPVRSKV